MSRSPLDDTSVTVMSSTLRTLLRYERLSVNTVSSSTADLVLNTSSPMLIALSRMNLAKGKTSIFKSFFVMSFVSSLACMASRTVASRVALSGALPLSECIFARDSIATRRQPVYSGPTTSLIPVTFILGIAGPFFFFFGGAWAFCTEDLKSEITPSMNLPLWYTRRSGSGSEGRPEFTTCPSIFSTLHQTCSMVCGQKGARSLVWTSQKVLMRSACMPSWPHWNRYSSLADCNW
mmetsp:Transcript_3027/g.10441  ORF Transcript_3027/g.10441 Transcript_3027/m.10441 type:complete len:235 (-) Transcript_3027:2575-3279(-)